MRASRLSMTPRWRSGRPRPRRPARSPAAGTTGRGTASHPACGDAASAQDPRGQAALRLAHADARAGVRHHQVCAWYRQFLLRDLDNVRRRSTLVTMAWNIKRMVVRTGAIGAGSGPVRVDSRARRPPRPDRVDQNRRRHGLDLPTPTPVDANRLNRDLCRPHDPTLHSDCRPGEAILLTKNSLDSRRRPTQVMGDFESSTSHTCYRRMIHHNRNSKHHHSCEWQISDSLILSLADAA